MAKLLSKSEVKAKIKEKRALETRLSQGIYDVFDEDAGAMRGIRATVRSALDSIGNGSLISLDEALKEEAHLQVWKDVRQMGKSQSKRGALQQVDKRPATRADLALLEKHVGGLNACQCGDAIRFIGAWVEFGGADYKRGDRWFPKQRWSPRFEKKGSDTVPFFLNTIQFGSQGYCRAITAAEITKSMYRGGVEKSGSIVKPLDTTYSPTGFSEGQNLLSAELAGKAFVWAQTRAKYVDKELVHKDDYENLLMGEIYGRYFHEYPERRIREKVTNSESQPVPGGKLHRHFKREQGAKAGFQLKKVGKGDSTLKIDNLFGLDPVCSISGTTADLSFVIDQWGHKFINHVADLSTTYYLLPVGSIAGFHHHSILEVALALSLISNTGIAYRVGFYRSLLPNDAWGPSAELRSTLNTKLINAEAEMRIKALHFLCYYENHEPAGGILLEWKDLDAFKRSRLSLATYLEAKAPSAEDEPTWEQLMKFIRENDGYLYKMIRKDLKETIRKDLKQKFRKDLKKD